MTDYDPIAERNRLQEVRRVRLRQLIEQQFAGIAEFARAIGEDLNYTCRLVKVQKSGRKNLGEGKARKIEAALGLPPGWLDQDGGDHSRAPEPAAAQSAPTWPFQFSRKIWDGLSLSERRRAESMLLTIINGIESERPVVGQDQEFG